MQIEEYIADKITALCEKHDISKYRLSQFFQEGNSENLTEEQKEVLRKSAKQMKDGTQSYRAFKMAVSCMK